MTDNKPTPAGNSMMENEILVTDMQTLHQIGMAHIGSKFEVQYVDYEEDCWTVPVTLTVDRLNGLWNDYSVKAVRLTDLVNSEIEDSF